MNYVNLDVFKDWLSNNLKSECFNFDACINDFETQIGSTGSTSYSLCGYETKSGNPEEISFERKNIFYLNGEVVSGENNDFDYVETTITF